MDIFECMDCIDCPSYRRQAAHITADAYDSEPEEAECSDGDFGGDYPCDRMLGAINDRILDGELETEHGRFIDREWAKQIQQGDTDCEVEPWFMDFDFSPAPFWWIPDRFTAEEPIPYKDEEEIYGAWFN